MDSCKNCSLRGALNECEKHSCSVHSSWYVESLLAKLAEVNELLSVIKEIRKSDCGAWLKDCQSGTYNCSEGRAKRQELMRLLDKLYKTAFK